MTSDATNVHASCAGYDVAERHSSEQVGCCPACGKDYGGAHDISQFPNRYRPRSMANLAIAVSGSACLLSRCSMALIATSVISAAILRTLSRP